MIGSQCSLKLCAHLFILSNARLIKVYILYTWTVCFTSSQGNQVQYRNECGTAPDANRHSYGGVGSCFQRQIIRESWKHRVLATAQRVWDTGMDKDVNETPWWVQRTELSRGWGLENGSLQLNLGREGFFGRQRVRQRGQTTQRMRHGLAGVSRS